MGFLGVDIGGTNVDFVLLDGDFRYLSSFKTAEVIGYVDDLIDSMAKKYNADRTGVGIAAWLKSRRIYRAPNLPVIPSLREEWIVENDANCFALYASKKLGYTNLLGLTVGTGIGTGVVIDRKIYRGRGFAGEMGHAIIEKSEVDCVCGRKGHIEANFGGWAIKRITGKNASEVDLNQIYSLEGFDVFCRGLAFAVMLMDFEAVVIGGRIGVRLQEQVLKKRVYSYLMPEFQPEIRILDDELAVAKGAALLAKDVVEYAEG